MEHTVDFNEKQITLLLGNDVSLLEQILDILKTDIPSHLLHLGQAIEQHDHKQIYEIAHTLKGSLANVGAEKGSSCAAHVLREAESKHTDTCRILYKSLQETTGEFLKEFTAYVEQKRGGS